MSDLTYIVMGYSNERPLVWLHGEIGTPPFSTAARVQAGVLLRQLQQGMALSMPASRPIPEIGSRCHELRINDVNDSWRIIYRVDSDAIVILDVFSKKTAKTPRSVIDACKRRLKLYDGSNG